MKLAVERDHLDTLIGQFPDLEPLRAPLRFGEKVEVPVAQLSDAQCDFLGDIYRGVGAEYQVRAAQLTTLRGVLGDAGKRYGANDLEDFLTDLVRYLLTDGLRGWLFSADISRRPLPYVVTRLDYTPTTNDESGKIFVELKANAKGTLVTNVFRVTAGDIDERTLGEVLVGKGFLKETPDLIAAYDATAERYFAWRGRYGEQFAAQGRAFYAEDPTSARRDTDWTRKDVVVLSASGGKARLVNDEGILTERSLALDVPGEILASYLRRAGKSNQYDNEEEIRLLASGIPADMFVDVPVHAFVLMDDIVEGKSGGTTVLCAGPPGVGKTLTAEVYSEIIRRPLYRVHSGQLGLNVTQMEAALKDVLTRAQRWGAVMLIDEADVYIKRREDDMTMNAVVGVFLRVLEYFNGLLFLTTNRVDDIDEAIVSRCIALIRYHQPDRESRARIWRVMLDQFCLAVDDALVERLADLFPQASGRDIKGLAKLTAKYCSHKAVPPGIEVFQRCSIFRGMDMDGSAQLQTV
ncbi:MAG: ATP-binding protein [Novosphingobium sp.]